MSLSIPDRQVNQGCHVNPRLFARVVNLDRDVGALYYREPPPRLVSHPLRPLWSEIQCGLRRKQGPAWIKRAYPSHGGKRPYGKGSIRSSLVDLRNIASLWGDFGSELLASFRPRSRESFSKFIWTPYREQVGPFRIIPTALCAIVRWGLITLAAWLWKFWKMRAGGYWALVGSGAGVAVEVWKFLRSLWIWGFCGVILISSHFCQKIIRLLWFLGLFWNYCVFIIELLY